MMDCLKQDKFGKYVIIFGVDMRSFPHIDNKKKYVLILGKRPAQGLEHTLTAEKLYSINFTKENAKILFGLVLQRS